MLYFQMEFGKLNIDELIDTGALSNVVPEADIRKIRLLAPHTQDPPPEFQNMVASGQLEAPNEPVEMQLASMLRDNCINMAYFTSPLIGFLLLQRKTVQYSN